MKTNICTVNDLKKLSTISENVDCLLLEPFLNISQEMYVMPILGTALYDDIIAQIDANTVSGNTETLINDYIIPAIAFGSWYSSAPFLLYKTQRNGVLKMSTDTLTPVDPAEMSIYMSKLENLKAFYCNRLEHYLCENKTTFPLYRASCTKQSNGGAFYLGWKTKTKVGDYWDGSTPTDPIYTDDNNCCD